MSLDPEVYNGPITAEKVNNNNNNNECRTSYFPIILVWFYVCEDQRLRYRLCTGVIGCQGFILMRRCKISRLYPTEHNLDEYGIRIEVTGLHKKKKKTLIPITDRVKCKSMKQESRIRFLFGTSLYSHWLWYSHKTCLCWKCRFNEWKLKYHKKILNDPWSCTKRIKIYFLYILSYTYLGMCLVGFNYHV